MCMDDSKSKLIKTQVIIPVHLYDCNKMLKKLKNYK